jgi:dodecin
MPAASGSSPVLQPKGIVMPNHTYKRIDLVGSSSTSITDAIESAIARAHKTTRNLEWFEVEQVRGSIFEGKVAQYQVVLKVGFRIEEPS